MVWESDPWPQIIWGNSSIVSLQFFKQAMSKVIMTGLIMRFQSFSNISRYSTIPFSFFSSLPPFLLPSWKGLTANARKKTENYISERKAKLLEMLPSDWRVCIYSFLIFFIQTQAETDEQEVVERSREDRVIAPSSRKCSPPLSEKRSSEGRRRGHGGGRATGQLRGGRRRALRPRLPQAGVSRWP